MININDQLTPRESMLMEAEQEEHRLAREHEVRMMQLRLEEERLQAKWAQLLRIPILILRLPILPLLGIAYIVCVARWGKAEDRFWDWLS